MWVLSFAKSLGQFWLFWTEGYAIFLIWNLCFNLLSVSSVFFSPLFSSRWRRIRLPPLLYITLSSFCLCLPTDAAHKELASMHGEGMHYRENISSPLCQPAPILFPSINPSFLFSFFAPHPSRLSFIVALRIALKRSQCMLCNKTHTHLVSQPGDCFLTIHKPHMCSKSSAGTKVKERRT